MQILGGVDPGVSVPQNAPTSLSAIPVNTSVAISFTAPTNDGGSPITNYEYSFDNSSWTALSPADATSPVTVSGLTQNTAYTVYLRAVNIVGVGPGSTGVSFTTEGVPTGTATITSVPVGTTTATVNFTVAAGGGAITGYDLYIANLTNAWNNTTASPISVTGLSPNTTYTFYVRAKNAYGVGPQSAGFNATTNKVAPSSVEYLVVAGGGGGGNDRGGGGGAGGYLTSSLSVSGGSSYSVTIGGGGTGSAAQGTNGGNSVFHNITAIGGGGGGGGGAAINGLNGGSGGGARDSSAANPGLGTVGQGNDGGDNGSVGPSGGGGGGAGAVGSAGKNIGTGNGGAGAYSSITGASTPYAGGGGGGGEQADSGNGGVGGGGKGGYGSNAVAGTANTGGGGGAGSGFGGATGNGANGGSGVVIIAYSSSFAPLTSISGLSWSVSTTSRSGFRVYTFTGGNGSITI